MTDATTNTASSAARIVHIERPSQHFTLLRDADGRYLSSADGVSFTAADDVDDAAIWQRTDQPDAIRHAATGSVLSALSVGAFGVRVRVRSDDTTYDDQTFTLERGPSRLPSESLREFEREGWVCLPAILAEDLVDELERAAGVGQRAGQHCDHDLSPINRSVAVARAAAEPVSLWLARRYMQTDNIRFGHPPSFAVLAPDDGDRDVQGWHSDYPYLWGSPRWVGGDRVAPGACGRLSLGVQRNTCISAFTEANGATCFKLGSHRLNSAPPRDWGVDADYAQTGRRRRHGLPYGGPDADLIEAPPGSIILYDARTWHRAGINRGAEQRAAMLQALTPGYIMPFQDTGKAYKAFIDGPLSGQLTRRERNEIARLMVHEIVGPLGRHAITTDPP